MDKDTNQFRPDNDAPAKQHLIDAALDELKQHGSGDDTEFLDAVNDKLDNIVIPLTTSKQKSKTLIAIGMAMAAVVTVGLFVAHQLSNQSEGLELAVVTEPAPTVVIKPSSTTPRELAKKSVVKSTRTRNMEPQGEPIAQLMRAESKENFKIEKPKNLPHGYKPSEEFFGTDNSETTGPLIAAGNISAPKTTPATAMQAPPVFTPHTTDHFEPPSTFVGSSNSLRGAPVDNLVGTGNTSTTGSSSSSQFLSHKRGPAPSIGGVFRSKAADEAKTKESQPLGGFLSTQANTKAERYDSLTDNSFASPLKQPLSTFSVDVDTASYSNIRRMINSGQAPPRDAVRIEEMINYFNYDYPQPKEEHPFGFAVETAKSPWNPDHQLLRVGIQGKRMQRDKRPAANLVFLLDVSGSMNSHNKLPLVKESMKLMIEELNENDTISIVVYAGAEGLCLPATSGDQKSKILKSLDKLSAGGSTNGGAGIQLAYKMAGQNFKKDGINRVILCSDGDFNVGRTDQGDLVSMVENKAKYGTYLTVLGFGSGNINDSMLEAITNKGNGNYFYIDSIKEGRKVLLQDLMSTLVTIAKDVKIQVEFNPKHVQNYRLIGYANRKLAAKDFTDDKIDAGEVGAGHSVTALYEIVPAGAPAIVFDPTNNLKYQKSKLAKVKKPKTEIVDSDELCTVKLRYKKPDSNKSQPIEQAVTYQAKDWTKATDDYQFAAAVALWGMQLRDSTHIDTTNTELILSLAKQGKGSDPFGRRQEFIELVKKWQKLQ